ncbi:MAG: M20/M25/M40 family metallo-hydrolase [Deltaproteobacteria bacterium]|nr:M20/M25/M40 family metallo-hydrolase [Deltaproteobacteria bacterium]
MLRRTLALALLFAATPASAFTPEEVTAAAAVAREVEADVTQLAADALEGRGSGTPGGAAARELLIDELEQIGPGLDTAASGREAYQQPFDGVRTNLLAVIPGGARADEFVIVGAHYDHIPPGGCTNLGDAICNGATDNAAGVAVVLAIGRALRALPAPPERSVVLALWDGEEIGLLGSSHFVAHPLVPLADVVSYVNFDIQGANLMPSVRELSFAIGTETGGALLTSLTSAAIDAVGLDTRLLSVVFGQLRSDYVGFHVGGVPIVFFSDATNACYHTSRDDLAVVDVRKLARQAEIGFRLVLGLAEDEQRPVLTPPTALTTFDDLLAISDVLTRSLADLDHVSPGYRDQLVALEAQARGNVGEGPEALDETETIAIATGAMEITTYGFPCDPQLLPEPGGGASAVLAALALAACARRGR